MSPANPKALGLSPVTRRPAPPAPRWPFRDPPPPMQHGRPLRIGQCRCGDCAVCVERTHYERTIEE